MKVFELRELPEHELVNRLKEEKENLANLFFQKATSQLESPIKIRTVRRNIAKMNTVIRERQIKGGSPVSSPIKPAPEVPAAK
ncbi:MAG TPA: 50S ribosomal protein L29 [Bacteroidota bacterium]|nr:50S ribosomal protein L29 [Bacteroidota bacterium]